MLVDEMHPRRLESVLDHLLGTGDTSFPSLAPWFLRTGHREEHQTEARNLA